MIKGWRTKPEWVKHYAEVREARANLRAQRMQLELQGYFSNLETQALLRRSEALRNQQWFGTVK